MKTALAIALIVILSACVPLPLTQAQCDMIAPGEVRPVGC